MPANQKEKKEMHNIFLKNKDDDTELILYLFFSWSRLLCHSFIQSSYLLACHICLRCTNIHTTWSAFSLRFAYIRICRLCFPFSHNKKTYTWTSLLISIAYALQHNDMYYLWIFYITYYPYYYKVCLVCCIFYPAGLKIKLIQVHTSLLSFFSIKQRRRY